MNQVPGTIRAIETAGDISLVSIAAGGELFFSLVIDTPATAAYLHPGSDIVMVFKETEVSLGKNLAGGLSLRNRFPARVIHLETGTLLSRVHLDFRGTALQALITTRSVADLKLAVNDEVLGLVKTNEISLTDTYL
ncbi:MAG: TOBE domain-containing protein [Adhaeribacter sp.]